MNYVDSLDMLGIDVKEIPCIKGQGAPSTAMGAVGLFYMDTTSGAVYKCVAESGGVFTWEPMASGGGSGGADGKDGKDGVSCTHSWNGTVLTVTSASGTSSADLKGDKGDTGATGPQGPKGDTGETGQAGYTPVYGVDYFTEAEKIVIIERTIHSIPTETWTFKLVDGSTVTKQVAVI